MDIITKGMISVLALGLLLFAAVLPSFAQESMIPDDFDWTYYLQNWIDDDWDSWGSYPQQNNYYPYGYQEPQTYNWYGQSYTVPYFNPFEYILNDYGYDDAVPSTTYPEPEYYQYPDYNQYDNGDDWIQAMPYYGDYTDTDDWFYQVEPMYDDFQNWGGSQYIPDSAYVSDFVGYQQTYNLDCEARSAVDLAAWFGVNISSAEFLYNLPKSDDPNVGFVGSWTDARGHIPPASYGVYQEPVAALLRSYGLNAVGVYAYTQDALKAQIAAGKPVMVWVVGNVEIGYSTPYTPASTGNTTYVVPYQHTVVVTGYDGDNVYIQDGALRYSRDWKTFLLSWGALGNRAIFVN